MMYPYVKYSDGTEVVFSNIYMENGQECIDVHFERPAKDGFDSVRIKLPTYELTVWEGNYTDEEIEFFKQVVKNSSDLFYKYAKEGGLKFFQNIGILSCPLQPTKYSFKATCI